MALRRQAFFMSVGKVLIGKVDRMRLALVREVILMESQNLLGIDTMELSPPYLV